MHTEDMNTCTVCVNLCNMPMQIFSSRTQKVIQARMWSSVLFSNSLKILLMEEILHQFISSVFPLFTGFYHHPKRLGMGFLEIHDVLQKFADISVPP